MLFWVLFENAMSLHRLKAAVIGLLESGRTNEWVVTEKLGDALRAKTEVPGIVKVSGPKDLHEPLLPITTKPSLKTTTRIWRRYSLSLLSIPLTLCVVCFESEFCCAVSRFHLPELGWGFLLICCRFYDIFVMKRSYIMYVLL